MTLAERRSMSSRLRIEAIAKNAHADALDAETDKLEQTGAFAESVELVCNIERLEMSAIALREHAEALRAYGLSRETAV
jgi:hypothetical protein